MLNNITSKWNGMIKTKRLVGIFGRFVGFNDAVNLFLGVAAGFGKKDFVAVDSWGFDVLETMAMVNLSNFRFLIIKNGLHGRQKLLHARNWGGI